MFSGKSRSWDNTSNDGIFFLHCRLDKPDLIETRANQSTQVLITTADTCFPAAGGIAAVTEAGPACKDRML